MKLVKRPAFESTLRFSAKLLPAEGADRVAAVLLLPKDVSGGLLSGDAKTAEGIINTFPFRATLQRDGKGNVCLTLNKALRDAADAGIGDLVSVEVTRVDDEAEVRAPVDLVKALASAPKAQAQWKEITPMARRDWILWLCSAKLEETRQTRIKKACSMLASGKRRVCCFGGLNWLTKDHRSVDTWLPLPSSTK
jgi:hypothetical protein